jgi:phage shock protein A
MDFSSFAFLDGFQIPLPVTLACACVCSYLIGQLPFARPAIDAPGLVTGDTERAKRLLDRLNHELENFRDDLAAHESSLDEFKRSLSPERQDRPSADQFTEDALRALRAMQRLADEMPIAFDSIRQTTSSAVDALRTEFRQHDEEVADGPQTVAERVAPTR